MLVLLCRQRREQKKRMKKKKKNMKKKKKKKKMKKKKKVRLQVQMCVQQTVGADEMDGRRAKARTVRALFSFSWGMVMTKPTSRYSRAWEAGK